jgi:acetyltransferase-like isoleucine patch superfamily enzyme
MGLKERIKSNEKVKALALFMLMPRNQARPRWWVRVFVNPFKHKRGKQSLICSSVRRDLLPFRDFSLGSYSTVEDFATLNNGVGDISIGSYTRIGIGSVLIGPVAVGSHVRLAQNVVCSGLNHSYQDVSLPIWQQPVTTAPITIGDESWLGANVVVVAGVSIGRHCVVAAGSVVTKSVDDYCVVAGNPAKVVKRYNPKTGGWEKPTLEVVT